jgi:superoxide reductase
MPDPISGVPISPVTSNPVNQPPGVPSQTAVPNPEPVKGQEPLMQPPQQGGDIPSSGVNTGVPSPVSPISTPGASAGVQPVVNEPNKGGTVPVQDAKPGDVQQTPVNPLPPLPKIEKGDKKLPVQDIPPVQPSGVTPQAGEIFPPVSQTVKPNHVVQPATPLSNTPVTPSPLPVTPPVGVVGTPAPVDEELRKTHEPIIDLPDDYHMKQTVPVKIKVGMIPHVMEEAHYIQSIELFANEKSVGRVDLSPKANTVAEAEFQVNINNGMKLKAVIVCNVHGKWETLREL